MSAYDQELLDEEDEEMPLTERDLADDAAWKIIQKNTFTRWANEHLKTVNKNIADLETDLADGLRLVALVEVLSGKKFKSVNRRPNFRTQKLENVTRALEFLEQDEGIRIVNIDSGDIVDSKLKLILGLIWTLILHYSISMPMWEGEEPQPQEGGPTPKQRLLNWINGKVPEMPIKNFTTDWNNGKAIGALVDALAPGLCPDWEDWDPKKAKQNAKEAMDAAEKWLDVPQLIKPDEMTNPKVDDLSMMTYLSQFPQAKLKPGAPLRPRLNAGKVRAFGPGIEPKGNRVGQLAKFTVETFSAGKGNLDVLALDPKGKQITCECVFNNDRNMTYSCSYMPQMEGEYRVIVKWSDKEIAKSPFKVLVEGAAGDASKVTAAGPGLEKTGVIVGKKTHFEVFTKDAGKGTVEVTILDPNGHKDKIKPTLQPINKDGVVLVEYTPVEVGLHSISITFSSTAIPKSPYGVNVGPAINPKAVYATGRGIQPRGVRVKQNAEFKVHTKDAGKGEVKVQIIGPGGVNLNCKVTLSKTEEGVYECLYIPPKVGQYVINITFGGQHITKSPFRVDVGPEKFTKIVAFGPGLEGGVVNQPACFTVETNGEVGALGFSIEGPSQAKIDCKDNGDGSADVTYWPTQPGEYAVHILCNEEDIPQAPYMAQIQPATKDFDASKVIAKGPGLEKDGVTVGKPAEFTVDARKAGKAPLHITCLDVNYKPVEVTVKDNKDGTYSCKYVAKLPVKHTVIITWGLVGIPKSPFRVNVSQECNPGKVKVYGPGVEKGVKTYVKTYFIVDCKDAGPGDVAIALTDDRGKDVPCTTSDNKDGTFKVEYEPTTPGTYTVQVYFATKEVPQSPIKVKVESSIDLSKVTVKGLETPIPLGETRKITIITTAEKKKDLPCKVTVTTPKNKTVELTTTKAPDGYTTDFKPLESGPHKVTVTYNNKPAPGSPFPVEVLAAGKKLPQIEVKGLDKPVEVGENRPVEIITSSMPKKDAPCKVTVTTPKRKTVELPLKKTPEGYTTTWTPTEQGPHKVDVDFDKKPVPDSPFNVEVVPKGTKGAKKDEPTAEITVKGLETPIPTGEKRTIIVVTTKATKKNAPCTVSATNPKGRSTSLKTKPVPEGYEAIFTPWDTGVHKIKVDYDSKELPDSPFSVEVYKVNVNAVVVKGLDKPIPLGETRQISIITKDAGKPDLPCKVTVTTPTGEKEELPTEKSPDGYTSNFTPKQPGDHTVNVEYASKEVPKSPFKVPVQEGKGKPKPAEQEPISEKIEPQKTAPTKAAPAPGAGGVTVKGLDAPVAPGEKRPVLVDTTKAPKKDAPCKLSVTNPKGRTTEMKTKQVPDGYESTFSSWDKGPHVVKVEYDGKEIPESPFTVDVEKIDVSKVTVSGLETPIPLGETRKITIITKDTGRADAPCAVISTSPKDKTDDVPTEKFVDGYYAYFTPKEKGNYKVKITFAGKEVPNSPFTVSVEALDVSGVKVKGLEKPIMVGEKRKISIITTPTGKKDVPCRVHVTNPKGVTTELFTSKAPDGEETFFTPTDLGEHKVKVEAAGQEVPGSEFPVKVTKFEQRVDVEGLDTPMVMGEKRDIKINVTAPAKPNKFAPEPTCKVTVQNPKGRNFEPKCDKKPEGFTTFFTSNEPGPHIFKIEYNGKEIPDSPITCEVEKLERRKVEVKGLETPIEVGEKRPIEVITTSTGKSDAPCKVTAIGPKGDTTELPEKKVPEGYEAIYAPLEVGPHKIKVEYAGKEVPKSPFPVDVVPKGKEKPEKPVKVTGLDKPVDVGEKRPVTVTGGKPDAPGKITATNPKGKPTDVPTKKVKDGFEGIFAPLEDGPYKVKVEQDGKEVPGSPFSVDVKPVFDISKVEVKGLETPIQPGEKRKIDILTHSAKTPDAPCKVTATNPKGKPTDLPTKKTPEGFEATFAPLEAGPHTVRVDFDNKEVPKSPFPVKVEAALDLSKVQISGLEKPVEVDETRPLSIVTKATGKEDAPISVQSTSPSGREIFLPTKKVPGGYEATFTPREKGPHKIKIDLDKKEVPQSPLTTNVVPKLDIKKLQVKGLEKPIMLGETRPISIITSATGRPDLPCKVLAKGPTTGFVELPTTKSQDGYECSYKPIESGQNFALIEYDGKEVPQNPYYVMVESTVDIAKVQIKGLEKPIDLGETRPVVIDTSSTGKPDAPCKVSVTNPKGQTAELPSQQTPQGYETLFAPLEPGPHVVKVDFAGQPVPDSPFNVDVMPAAEVGAVTVAGLETPIEVGEARPVQINTQKTGKPDAPCRVTSTNPQGQTAELPTQQTPEGYQTVFAPLEPGPHKVNVNFAEKEVPKSPFSVDVQPKVDIGAVEVMGLETPIKVGEPRPITIMTSTTGKPDAPCKVAVTTPKGQTVELPTRKIPEGYTATLAPQEVGPHKVNVDFNGKPVPKSPFDVMAEPAIDFSKVKVSGLDEPVEVGEIRPVTVDTAQCGVVDAPCQVTASNPVGQVRELPLQKTPTGYQAQFAPLEEGPHLVAVQYAGKEVPKSPFPVSAVPQGPPASKVKAYGPGLDGGVAETPCSFTIDTREVTQPGGIGVTVEGPAESKIECRDNQDGTCDVTYYPEVPGDYNINVTYADEHIPKSPFTAKVAPSGKIDVSKVKAYGPGLEPGVFLDSPTGFTVDAKSVAPTGEGKVRAIVTSPSGTRTESLVKNNEDGTYDVLYTPYEQGPNTVDITYENIPIPQSPVKVNATPGCDATRVKAYGPGLEGGVTNTKQVFTVDVKGAGQGGLALAIDGPAETQINCKDNRDGTCEVEYVPVKKGDYDVTIKFADQHIPGSPFHVGIKDDVNPQKVKCYGPGLESDKVCTDQPASFTVDTSEAGEAPLDVQVTDTTGRQQPADIIPVAEGKYECTYYPVAEGPCKVDVTYANQSVPKSPFNVQVQPGSPADKVILSGDGILPTVAASMPQEFTIDTTQAGKPEPVDVVIQRPDGTYIRPMIKNNEDGTYLVRYTPEDCGPYCISVTYGDKPVKGCPIKTTAIPTGDASKCKITDGLQQTIPVEKETVITVDASEAGTGKVTCRIRSPTGAEIDIDIVDNSDGTFSINFTPNNPGDYSINIKFGGISIPQGEYIIQVGEDLITPDQIDSTQAAPGVGVYPPQEFCIPVGPIFTFVTAYIVMPSGKKVYPKIEDNKDGTVTVRYQPQETGLHELHLCYNQQEIPGSPFQFHVDAVNSGFVTAYGPGLSHGTVGVPAEFTIVTKDAGAGGLSLAIEGPSKTEIKCKDNEDGTCTVTYLPTAPGEYNITVKFADKNISGSPFVAKVTAGEPKQKAQIGRSSEVSLKITETDITNLTASIRSPSGQEEPCMLKRLPNGHLGISFTPRETGEHLVNVYRNGQPIANSPFKINVGETELGNASKVKVYGKGLQEGMANEVNEFIVDTREAGYGGLSLSIEGPSKADIECHDNEDGTCRVTYKPTEPGTYIINIKFADEHVPGSPFKVAIGGEPSERVIERIMRHREAVDVTHVGSECELSLKIPASFLGYQPPTGTSPFDMTASVTSPNGVTELCDVVSLDDCHYSIKFVPKEMGIHTVSVKHKDMHIPGSPFQFTVGPIAGGGAHKVHAAGLGLVRGEVVQPNEFNIYTREAGAGGLSIAVEGPSKAEVDFEDRKDGSCGVTYVVTEPGEYMVSIKFNDEHIPDSPFRVPITPSIGDARKISVQALQSKGLQIGKPCSFVVNFNGAPKGKLQARVVSPSGSEDEALVQEIDEGEYAVRFIPKENGPHLVYISFDGCQIPDSPFRIQVGTVHADPGMVQAYGDGLRTGKTDEIAKFIVNTVNAGSGALSVTVEGPSKVKLECREVEDGYEFTYKPSAPGDYLITIKYAGTNIAGSPYKARIEGQGKPTGFQEQASVVVETVTKTSSMSKFASFPPFKSDASKVTVEGNGLKKGYRNKQCTFNVDTSQAGHNMLFIGMIGPKGPCEELCVKHYPGNPYKINYLVKERGDYMLAVKWGDEHIPGSPFYVKVE
ncbi:hypothetical protein ACF0H5_014899 [Mactra antiquata]